MYHLDRGGEAMNQDDEKAKEIWRSQGRLGIPYWDDERGTAVMKQIAEALKELRKKKDTLEKVLIVAQAERSLEASRAEKAEKLADVQLNNTASQESRANVQTKRAEKAETRVKNLEDYTEFLLNKDEDSYLRIKELKKVLIELRHQDNHTIKEEMWRIDDVLNSR